MKEPTRGPLFACLYPGLCQVARNLGYALAIHGSLVIDLDLIACPWTEDAVPAEQLKDALMEHIGAVDFEGTLRRDGCSEEIIKQVLARPEHEQKPAKPHGRLAWNLYLVCGTKIDLSIMPLAPKV